MEIVTPPPVAQQRAGSLLAAAYGPGTLTRAGFGATGADFGACTGWKIVDDCTAAAVDVGSSARGDIEQGVPFRVQAEDECTTLGDVDLEARARLLLERVQSAAIARELWTGELATAAIALAPDGGQYELAWQAAPRLAGPGTSVVAGGVTAVPLIEGIAALEQELGAMLAGEPGVLHMTRGTLTTLAAKAPGLVRREGDVLLSPLDTRLVADAGYTGTSTAGAAPAAGQAWIYATARPAIWLSDVEVPGDLGEQTNRSTNRTLVRASRYALTLVRCGVLAARVTL